MEGIRRHLVAPSRYPHERFRTRAGQREQPEQHANGHASHAGPQAGSHQRLDAEGMARRPIPNLQGRRRNQCAAAAHQPRHRISPPSGARGSSPAGSNLVAFSEIVRAMKDAPTHRIDLASISGTNHDSICTLIRHMHDIRLIHVAGWERGNSGIPKQLMAWGDRQDKPRPPRLVRPKSGEQHRRRKQLRMLQAVAGVPWSPSASGKFMRQNKDSVVRSSFDLAEAA